MVGKGEKKVEWKYEKKTNLLLHQVVLLHSHNKQQYFWMRWHFSRFSCKPSNSPHDESFSSVFFIFLWFLFFLSFFSAFAFHLSYLDCNPKLALKTYPSFLFTLKFSFTFFFTFFASFFKLFFQSLGFGKNFVYANTFFSTSSLLDEQE